MIDQAVELYPFNRERKSEKCELCNKSDWIYTCPRCLFHSCSSLCVKQHKKRSSCTGIRDKTAYVSLQKYNESHMMSDYTYLEDVSRRSDNVTRSRLNTTKNAEVRIAESRARSFAKTANLMGVNFSCLPVGMSRHKLNQSNYSKNLKEIFWTIEVNFCHNTRKERYLEHSFPSNKPFVSFFENLLFSPTPQGKGSYHILRHQNEDFIKAGLDHFTIALKKESSPAGHFVDITSCSNSTFNDILKDETIIEYPIIYVWLTENGVPEFVRSLEEKNRWITTLSIDKEVNDSNSEDNCQGKEDEEIFENIENQVEADKINDIPQTS